MKQLSVFLENREGRLEECLTILKDEGINVISLSLADTTDYGMLRLIVKDPEKSLKALKACGFSASLSDVVAIKLPHTVGSLQGVLHTCAVNKINVEYMYALCTKTDEAAIVIKPSATDEAVRVLSEAHYDFFEDGDMF